MCHMRDILKELARVLVKARCGAQQMESGRWANTWKNGRAMGARYEEAGKLNTFLGYRKSRGE